MIGLQCHALSYNMIEMMFECIIENHRRFSRAHITIIWNNLKQRGPKRGNHAVWVKGNTIHRNEKYSMPEWWYFFWRKHHQRSNKVIIPVPPVDSKDVNGEYYYNPDKHWHFPLPLK